ncbi:hypothetical protein H9Q70_010193 [Fusarium xylarioides]|nr:hypothetical protein H9Q70_010193 [Fusarium xylarioides]KAG5776281.1 hypothetical protein H9Q73_010060 [Fusarium xylarioides]
MRRLELGNQDVTPRSSLSQLTEAPETRYGPAGNQPLDDTSPAEWSNAEDYEFDESQDFDNTTDGMGSLVTEPGKVGYTGPQSGVAALKFLQTLHLYIPANQPTPFPLDGADRRNSSEASPASISEYINSYFRIYHSSYPILHEGTFRARLSGALAKPRDVGVNVRPPSNLNDQDLAVDMESLPDSRDGPSTTACLVQHAKLAQIANMVEVEPLAHQIPGHERAVTLDRSIAQWRRDLPPYFDET